MLSSKLEEMITHENICAAAKQLLVLVEKQEDKKYPFSDLLEKVGVSPKLAGHLFEHAFELGFPIDPNSFAIGTLLALLAAQDALGETLSAEDIASLLEER